MQFRREHWSGKNQRLINWHRWFAWRPVRMTHNDYGRIAWLEVVERRGHRWQHNFTLPGHWKTGYWFEYRALD